MRLLLDTHAFIWWNDDDARLPGAARRAVGLADQVYVSIVSAWETVLKINLGKLSFAHDFSSIVARNKFESLNLTYDQIGRLTGLPLHHRDPFDRMLICQAFVENLTLITGDRRMAPYGVPIIWA